MVQQIAIVSKSRRISDDVLAFAAAACDIQVQECAAAWGIDPTPVAWYSREQGLPTRDVRIMAVVDDMDEEPGALGYHTDVLGVVFGRVLAQDGADEMTVTLSHECLEELIDPTCDKWRPIAGTNRLTALEACDAVEADTYEIKATILGETRPVRVSNYLLPRWFDPQANGGAGPFDRLAHLGAPFTLLPGGYMLVRDQGSNDVEPVFARDGAVRMAAKRRNPDGRLKRRGLGQP